MILPTDSPLLTPEQREQRVTRVSIWTLVVLHLVPAYFVAGPYLAYAAGRITLGHWPRPSLDDPAEIGTMVDVFYVPSLLTMIAMPLFFIASTVMGPMIAVRLRRMGVLAPASAWVLAVSPMVVWIGGFILHRADPLDVINWFMD